ncbi:GNAT family N-acetyltransferase [Leucobacter sp. CSA2]|uniref:GNAT family N-acetyltransferase n=1 Tax=Leucobacter edaphi TaxID=2796472 RepID=A0A934QCG8_9MICO|nr:GNAT family N-acetyltransferase [Leucobacter edaphi]MBK0422126.1 GNAT family N-acetyltransferase [Leucobacter edaphi]
MDTTGDDLQLRIARSLDEIPVRTLYRIGRLRQEVFVVEQECVYLDLDGRDLEPGAVQLWFEAPDGTVAASVRILREHGGRPGLRSIGRVVTHPDFRGRGIAARLVEAAIAECSGDPILIHAQSYLTEWYARFGFAQDGEEFLEDGIPHTPMSLG